MNFFPLQFQPEFRGDQVIVMRFTARIQMHLEVVHWALEGVDMPPALVHCGALELQRKHTVFPLRFTTFYQIESIEIR